MGSSLTTSRYTLFFINNLDCNLLMTCTVLQNSRIDENVISLILRHIFLLIFLKNVSLHVEYENVKTTTLVTTWRRLFFLKNDDKRSLCRRNHGQILYKPS